MQQITYFNFPSKFTVSDNSHSDGCKVLTYSHIEKLCEVLDFLSFNILTGKSCSSNSRLGLPTVSNHSLYNTPNKTINIKDN